MAANTNLITSFIRRISKYFDSSNFTWPRPKRVAPGANHIDNPTDFDARTIYRGEEIVDFTQGKLYTQDGGEIVELNSPSQIIDGLRTVTPSVVGAFGGGALYVSVESGAVRINGKNYYHESAGGTAVNGDITIAPNTSPSKGRIDIIAAKSDYPNPAPSGIVGTFGIDSTEYAAGLTAIAGTLYNQGRALTFTGDYPGAGNTITISSILAATAISAGDAIIGLNISGTVTVTSVATSGGLITSIDISATPVAASTSATYAVSTYLGDVYAIKGDISAGSNTMVNVFPQPLLNDLIIGQGIPDGTIATNVATPGTVVLSNSATLTKPESIFQIGDVVDHILYDATTPWPNLPTDHVLLGLVYVPNSYTALSTPNTLRPWSVSDIWNSNNIENQTTKSLVNYYLSTIQEYSSDTTYMSGSTVINPQAQTINRVVKNHYSSDLDTSLSTGMMVQVAAIGNTAKTLVYSVTYSVLETLILGSSLVECAYYIITDFETIYDRPDYNANATPKSVIDTVTAAPELIMVLATSSNTLDGKAYSLDFPDHQIKYDVTFNQTEYNNSPAKGRITERIDSYGNRADYDTEAVSFKRYTYYFSNGTPYTGTLDFDGTTNVVGVGTLFTTELSVGDIFVVSGFSFKVDTITDNFTMTIVSNNFGYSPLGVAFYGSSYYDLTKKEDYRDNNTNVFQLVKTFGSDCYDNYIGNNTGYYAPFIASTFILSNNTIRANSIGNVFGLSCINNHIYEYSKSNVFGNSASGNIQTNGSFEYNNIISEAFQNNIMVGSSITKNTIGDVCAGNLFLGAVQDNIIESEFQNNTIEDSFNNNVIGFYFTNNIIGTTFNGNSIGNDFAGNTIGNGFINNVLGNEFQSNTIGDSCINNIIGNNFAANSTGSSFSNNSIGYDFNNNTIGNGFIDNSIKNSATGNTIGNSFYNNTIFGLFQSNTIGDSCIGNFMVNSFSSNIIVSGFRQNITYAPIVAVDFTLATHVYNGYICELTQRVDITKRLKYMDNLDVTVVVNIDS